MNLKELKIESCASMVCFIFAFFFKIAFLIALILQFRCIYALHKDSQSATLLNRFAIAWVLNGIFVAGLAFVTPSFSVSMGFNTFYIGTIMILTSAPLLLNVVFRFAKEMVAITGERLFWAIFGLSIVTVLMGILWVLSYLWYWLYILYGFMQLNEAVASLSALGIFAISVLLVIAVICTDEIRANNEIKNDNTM